ncbi:MAG: hypothetical protein RR490_09870 [Niameybacter sp.]
MIKFKDVHSTVKPPDKLETPTMVDLNSNIRQEMVPDIRMDGEQKESLQWVYDTLRFESWQEYTNWILTQQEQNSSISQEAIGELSMVQAQYQTQNEMALAELTMMIGGV